jgi:hypothetical protein
MNVFRKIDGSTYFNFTIGLRGPAIWQDVASPDDLDGNDGDLFIHQGSTPRFYSKSSGSWMIIANDSAAVRGTAIRGVDLTLSSGDSLLAIIRNPFTIDSTTTKIDSEIVTIDNDVSSTTVVTLGAGTEGQSLVIKDEAGLAGSFTIRATDSGGQIDGSTYQDIASSWGYIELLYSSGAWRVVGR